MNMLLASLGIRDPAYYRKSRITSSLPTTGPEPGDQSPNTRLFLAAHFVDYVAHGCQHSVRSPVHVMMRVHYNLPSTSGEPCQARLQLMNPDLMIFRRLPLQTWRRPVSSRGQHDQREITQAARFPCRIVGSGFPVPRVGTKLPPSVAAHTCSASVLNAFGWALSLCQYLALRAEL